MSKNTPSPSRRDGVQITPAADTAKPDSNYTLLPAFVKSPALKKAFTSRARHPASPGCILTLFLQPTAVAQIGNLPYRRLEIGRAWPAQWSWCLPRPADCQSALRQEQWQAAPASTYLRGRNLIAALAPLTARQQNFLKRSIPFGRPVQPRNPFSFRGSVKMWPCLPHPVRAF